MARTAQLRYAKTTVVSGSVYQLTTTAGAAANNATLARYAVGGTTSSRRFVPLAVASTETLLPSVGTTAANVGWRDNVAENANDQVRYVAGVWTTTVRYRRSGQVLEVDQNAKVTAVFYRVTTGGTHVAELGRVTSAEVTYTTTVQTLALSTASIGPFTFNAGDKVQIELYVQTFAAGLAAAPAVATDLWLTIDESSTSTRVSAVPTYDILYARAAAESAPAADSLVRAATLARAVANTAPAADTLIRRLAFPRALADSASAADTLVRSTGIFARAIPNTAPAADAMTRAVTMARAIPNTAPAADALLRSTVQARALADTAPAADTLARSAGTFVRAIPNTAPAADTLLRAVTMARAPAESAPAVDALLRQTVQARALADAAPAADMLARMVAFPRAVANTAPAADALLRQTVQARALADSAPAADALARATSLARAIANAAAASDALARVLTQARALADSAPASDALARAGIFARAVPNTAPAADALVRAFTAGRFLDEEIGTTAVDNVRTPGRVMAGVARDSAGVAVSGATIKLFRQVDDRVVRTMVTVAGGAYSFSRDIFDTNAYYVVAYIEGVPQTHGVTDRGLVPALV